ncbi:hypothetical protein PC39_13682 [Salinisphaera sp. PC39]|uniref:AI-2E family transporter n=1 Tax=Salinisphaera sp. PC39 TaxID=1304156 RepID=UPI00334039CF
MTDSEPNASHSRQTLVVLLSIITIILVGWALKATYVVTMPLTLAFFVTLVLRPLQRRLDGWLPARLRWLSVMACMSMFVAVLGLLGGTVWLSLGMLFEKAPAYIQSGQQLWDQWQALAQRHEVHLEMLARPLQDLSSQALALVTSGVGYLWLLTAMLLLVFFLVLLMLIEAGEWREKIASSLGEARARAIMGTVYAASEQVRRFLVVKTWISALTGVSSGLWLWWLGVDFALLWGIVIFLLNFIPYVGSTIAVVPPTIIALLQFGPWQALSTLVGLIIIQQVLGNFVDPRLAGRTLAIPPIVVLVSIVFWGWVWGLAGALIGVLLTATLVIVLDHIPALRPAAILLSRKPAGSLPAGACD